MVVVEVGQVVAELGEVVAGGTRQGWLVGLDRDIGKNFRIGAGYNFTSSQRYSASACQA